MLRILKILIPSFIRYKMKELLVVLTNSRLVESISSKLTGKTIVHVLHIGKTGGTAVKEALRNNLETRNYKIKLHKHRFRLRDVPAGSKTVFFLRDPLERFISSFYSRKRQGRPRHNTPWNLAEKTAFSLFSTPNELATALSSTDTQTREAAVHAMQTIRHVRDFYSTWFEDERYFMSRLPDIMFIGFQETLKDDFTLLKKTLGLADHVQLPVDKARAHANPDNLDTSLADTAIRNLEDWYESDYKFIALCEKFAHQVINGGATA